MLRLNLPQHSPAYRYITVFWPGPAPGNNARVCEVGAVACGSRFTGPIRRPVDGPSVPGASMPADTTLPPEPTRDALSGDRPMQVARRLLLATRPQFLSASALPVVIGTAWAAGRGDGFDAALFALALGATLAIHAGCNVLNDVADEVNGSDRANTGRIHPFTGGSRFIQNDVLSVTSMTRLGLALLAAGAILGGALAWLRGPGVIVYGVLGVALGIAYSLPPFRLVSRGLGEAVIAATFGLLPVTGAAWLQGSPIDPALIMLSLASGAWVATILLINEVPDAPADASVGKNTLVVRGGQRTTSAVYVGLHAAAAAAITAIVFEGSLPPGVLFVAALAIPVVAMVARRIAIYDDDQRLALVGAIRGNLALQAVGSLWLAGFALWGANV